MCCSSFPEDILHYLQLCYAECKNPYEISFIIFFLLSSLFKQQTLEIGCPLKLYIAFRDHFREQLIMSSWCFDRHTKVNFGIASVIDNTTQSIWDSVSKGIFHISSAAFRAYSTRRWICQSTSLDGVVLAHSQPGVCLQGLHAGNQWIWDYARLLAALICPV